MAPVRGFRSSRRDLGNGSSSTTAQARPVRWPIFDKEHRAKGWDGVGYHFVIGNGTNTGDGQIEVAPRWPIQKWGAHAKTPDNRYNEYGIGICLVGNFDTARPTAKQMQSLEKLVAYLMQTYHIPAAQTCSVIATPSRPTAPAAT